MKRFLTFVLALTFIMGLGLTTPAHAATGGKLIALTFDDGPGSYTNRLLDGLKARGVKVTFFTVGKNIKRRPEVVARAYREGHQIANHSYDHTNLTTLPESDVRKQIRQTNDLLNDVCGAGTTYMVRAPYGSTNATVRSAVGAPLVYWAVDPKDWKDRDAATVKSRVVSGAHDGAIILLHDTHSTSVDGALAAIDTLLGQGYEFVTVAELFRRRGVTMENGVSYTQCKPNGTDLGPVTVPEFSSRTVDGKLEITLTAQAGAKIYYSFSGAELNQSSTRYTGPFTVSTPCTVWAAAAYNMNGSRSGVITQSFTKPAAQSPLIQVSEGIMTLENRTPGAEMFYTLDGSAAENFTRYTGPVVLTPGTMVSACAGGQGYLTSTVSRAAYTTRGNLFRDVFPDSWYYDAVDQAVGAGFMVGDADGCLFPDQTITRSQLVTMLYRRSGEEVTSEERTNCPFRDLGAGGYDWDAVCWARAKGIIGIYEGDDFNPDKLVNRQELSKILVDFLRYRGAELPDGSGISQSYADAEEIDPRARTAVEIVSACGLMQGNDAHEFLPNMTATRAQAAAVLVRIQNLEQEFSQQLP